MTFKVLDAFCGAGGAGYGYSLAGASVTGVDVDPSVRRAYLDHVGEFVLGDAIDYVREWGWQYDLIHLSPPCQHYSKLTKNRDAHPDLIGAARDAALSTGKAYVIENVEGARPHLLAPTLLCGAMFGLTATDTDGTPVKLIRHRLFETSWPMRQPPVHVHDRSVKTAGVYGGGAGQSHGYKPTVAVRRALMQIDWMSQAQIAQSIPPSFTRYVANSFLGTQPPT